MKKKKVGRKTKANKQASVSVAKRSAAVPDFSNWLTKLKGAKHGKMAK